MSLRAPPAGATSFNEVRVKTFWIIYTFFLNSGDTLVAMDDYIVLAPDKIQRERAADMQAEKFRNEWLKTNSHFFHGVIARCMEADEE